MKTNINIALWQHRFFIFLFFSFITLACMAPLASCTTVPQLNDLANHLNAIIQAKMALIEGQFPLRVAPFEHNGMGYPYFQFYSPTSYTLAGLIHLWLTPNNPLLAYKITVWLALTLGGIYIYRTAYQLVNNTYVGLLTGVLYLTSPLLLLLLGHIGALNELVGLGILPITLFYNLNYFNKNKNITSFLLSSGSWYLLATTHLITFVYFSCFFGLLLLLLTLRLHTWRSLFYSSITYLFGWALAAWFLMPILLFNHLLVITQEITSPAHFNEFTSFLSLLSTRAMNAFPFIRQYFPIQSPANAAFGWPTIITIVIATYCWLTRYSFNKNYPSDFQQTSFALNSLLPALLILFYIVFLLVWSPFNVWHYLPQWFSIAQYSWRLLGQAIWITALLFPFALLYLFHGQIDKRHLIIGTLILGIATSSWVSVTQENPKKLDEFIKNPSLNVSGIAYLMDLKKISLPTHTHLQNTLNTLSVRDINAHCIQQNTIKQCTLTPSNKIQFIHLPALYYPDLLEIKLNNQSVITEPAIDNNFLVTKIKVQPNILNIITINFRGLSWANKISQLAWFFASLLFLFKLRLIKQNKEINGKHKNHS